ncbi:MAG: phosphoribosyltransferase [Candidatus Bathyarchaeia archaeon]
MFRDRVEAGQRLAKVLSAYKGKDTIVLAIPRGGVVVGYQVAQELDAPLDIIVPRKVGAPNNPELAIGAVTQDGSLMLDPRLVELLRVPEIYIEEEARRQVDEIRRRMARYRGEKASTNLGGKVVILVDDGIATGATMRAAIASIRRQKPAVLVVAVAVGPPREIENLKGEVDRVVCLMTPEPFYAIGQFYRDFSQTSDEEVINLLQRMERGN